MQTVLYMFHFVVVNLRYKKKKNRVSKKIFLDILAEIEPSESLLFLKVYAVLFDNYMCLCCWLLKQSLTAEVAGI